MQQLTKTEHLGLSLATITAMASSGELWKRNRVTVDDEKCTYISELANISPNELASFSLKLNGAINAALINYFAASRARRETPVRFHQLQKVEQAAQKLLSALVKLNDDSQKCLGPALGAFENFGEVSDRSITRLMVDRMRSKKCDIVTANTDLAEFAMKKAIAVVAGIKSAAEFSGDTRKKKRGRPSLERDIRLYDPDYSPLDQLVESIEYAVLAHGGKSTFNKNDGTGTLIMILRALSHALPRDLLAQFISDPSDTADMAGLHRIYAAKRRGASQYKKSASANDL